MLLSRKALQRVLGVLWLIDGLLQLQPQMFTMNMVNGVMKPMLQGQPGFIEPDRHPDHAASHRSQPAHRDRADPARPRLPLVPGSLGRISGRRLLRVGAHRLVRG